MTNIKVMKKTSEKHDFINLAVDSCELTVQELGVYMCLIRFANEETGYAYPSLAKIMKHCNIGKKDTVIKYIDSLESKGFIVRDKGCKGKSTRYYFVYKVVPQMVTSPSNGDTKRKFKRK